MLSPDGMRRGVSIEMRTDRLSSAKPAWLVDAAFEGERHLPGGGVSATCGDSRSKSAVSRRFVELSATRMAEWMALASDLAPLDLLAIQIDGPHIQNELILGAAPGLRRGRLGVDVAGDKPPLAVVEGATENAATVQALLDNLIGRGLDPAICRLFIVDGAKALTKAIRPPHADPALPGSQGAQRGRTPAQASLRLGRFGVPLDERLFCQLAVRFADQRDRENPPAEFFGVFRLSFGSKRLKYRCGMTFRGVVDPRGGGL